MMPSIVEKRSYGSVEVFWLDSAEAIRRLGEAAQRLVADRQDVVGVYLFGSLAEGRAVPGSDADILILLDHADRRWVDRPLEFAGYFDGLGMPVDLFCYAREEAARNPMARRASEHGTPLVQRPGGVSS